MTAITQSTTVGLVPNVTLITDSRLNLKTTKMQIKDCYIHNLIGFLCRFLKKPFGQTQLTQSAATTASTRG